MSLKDSKEGRNDICFDDGGEMNYHGRMVNIPADAGVLRGELKDIFMIGHREARRAAAEIANEADQEIEELKARLKILEGQS